MLHFDFADAIHFISSNDSRKIKRGLQQTCNAIEAGYSISSLQKAELILVISKLKTSNGIKVRRWLYKLIGLLGDKAFTHYLVGQLRFSETDPENKTWATAALFALEPFPVALQMFLRSGQDFYGTSFELAAFYFRRYQGPLDYGQIKSTLETDNGLSYQWVSLLYAQNRLVVPKEVILDLNRHHDSQVAEYSVWAVHRDQFGSIADLRIYPQEIFKAPSNIRRWYYRVLTKHEENLYPYYDLIQHVIHSDHSYLAREGLALGLRSIPVDKPLAHELVTWFHHEPNELVRLSLLQHFLRFQHMESEYRGIVESELRNTSEPNIIPLFAMEEIQPAQSKNIMQSGWNKTLGKDGNKMSLLPDFADYTTEHTYVLAIDTVDFSSRTDTVQIQIFRDLLGALSLDRFVRQVHIDDVVTLLTGDGLLLAFRGIDNRHAPLNIAFSLLDLFKEVRTYSLRFGVNNGPAFWIKMADGSRQLIGHAINWAVRVMSAAEGNTILVSDLYFNEILRPSMNYFRGYKFTKAGGLFTKKGEEIRAYLVEEVQL